MAPQVQRQYGAIPAQVREQLASLQQVLAFAPELLSAWGGQRRAVVHMNAEMAYRKQQEQRASAGSAASVEERGEAE